MEFSLQNARRVRMSYLLAGVLSLMLRPQIASSQCNPPLEPPTTVLGVTDRVVGAFDRLRIQADFILPVSAFAALDPSANGATVVVEDAAAMGVLSQVLPAGAYDPNARIGWDHNDAQTIWRFRNNNPGAPETNGIRRLALIDRSEEQANQVRLRVIGARGDYPMEGFTLPIKATVTVDNLTGDCGATDFVESECLGHASPAVNAAKCVRGVIAP